MYLKAVVFLAVGLAVVVQAVPQAGGGGLGVRVEVKVVLEVRVGLWLWFKVNLFFVSSLLLGGSGLVKRKV